MLLLACSFAYGADYIRLATYADGDIAYQNQTVTWEFYLLRECPDPAMIMGCSNGWHMDATGGATWEAATNFTPFSDHMTVWNLGGLLFTDAIDGTGMTSGDFLTGGAAMPPAGGMPVYTTEKFWFSLDFTYGSEIGEICIDSQFVFSAGAWKFSGLTCGLGGSPDRPLFLDGAMNDVHPICITIDSLVCMGPDITNCPTMALTGNHCNAVTYTFMADAGMDGLDPATIVGWDVIAGEGGINSAGEYSVGPLPTGTYNVTVEVENSCGNTDQCNFDVTFTNNGPAFTNCPPDPIIIGRPNTATYNFTASDADPCDGLVFTLSYNGAPDGVVDMGTDGSFSWATTSTTPGGTYDFTAMVMDGEGGEAFCQFRVEVLESDPFFIYIDKLEDVYQGCYAYPGIWLEKGSEYFGGFDFLIGYDASAMTFMSAQLGTFLNECWEYFTYRYNWNGNCGGSCPSGLLRVVGIADINNGANHPDVGCLKHPGGVDPVQLVVLTFYVTNDRTYECMYAPIRFFWDDCGDNTVSNVMGDTLWLSRFVYTYEGVDVTGTLHYGGHWWLGDCENPDPEKPFGISFIDFKHGGLDIICADSIDARGDINLNNIDNEIADAVLFTNYFIYGLGVFDINPQGQIAATDVNNDGRVLTVGDLVYLVRIITGDALPFPKLSPFANDVNVSFGDVVSTKSTVDIGAALFVFDGETDVQLLADGMKMVTDVVEGQTRVLVWSDKKNRIAAGNTEVIAASGNLVEASVSDYYGNEMNVNLNKGQRPTDFALMQNYPNPFNPATDITIKLPNYSEYRLDIYNVAGQLVKSFSGSGVGNVTVTWNATDVASGIYFYKATAGDFSATKKMVLMM
jgi:hypothetical protein